MLFLTQLVKGKRLHGESTGGVISALLLAMTRC